MKKQLVSTIIITLIPFLFVSCVSSLFKDSPPTFSSEVKFNKIPEGFVKTDTSVYPSWKNSKTGNVIAIVSDCNENSQYKLSNLHQLIEEPLENIKVIKEETLILQSKPAFFRIIDAELDGLQIEIQSVSFKRKSCSYVSSLSGKLNNLNSDIELFEQFLNGLSFE